MQQRVYECRMNSVDEMKQHFVEVWKCCRLFQTSNDGRVNNVGAAINEWRKWLRACVRADGKHFEHLSLLSACVTDKSYGQVKYK